MYRKTVFAALGAMAVVLAVASVAWACVPSGFGTPAGAVNLSPTNGPRGTSVTVTAQGYQPNVAVQIELVSGGGQRRPLGTHTPGADGRLSASVTIPDVPPAIYIIYAGSGGGASYEVTLPPAVVAPPVTDPVAPPQPAAAVSPAPAPEAGPALAALLSPPAATASGPRVSARSLPNQRLATVLTRGLVFSVECSEACRLEARVAVRAAMARGLRLPGTVARRSGSLSRPGRTTLVMKLSRSARTKLRRMRTVTLLVTLTGTGRAGDATVVRKTVKLRR